MTLKELKPGQTARIITVGGEGALRQHFLDMGVIPGAEATLVKLAPLGDPMELRIHGYELTLRLADAEKIKAEMVTKPAAAEDNNSRKRRIAHPGLGEEGKFHPKGSGDPLPEGALLTFALVGNQNSGKTTLFNQLTGSNQHVGNFPGVTVDRKDGAMRGHDNTLITDLPGIYSMSPYSSEELVSRDFVLEQKPKAIINIVDATNIERNLYLTMQLLEMNVPMVVALNMMDEMRGNGGTVDINRMESMLGVPVVPISAAKNQGVDELVKHAVHIAKYQEKPLRQDFCDSTDNGGAVHRCLHAVGHLIEDHAAEAGLPLRFAASKIIEGDELILNQLNLDQNEKDALEHIVFQMEKERKLDRSAAMADMRFAYIRKVCDECVIKPKESKEHIRSEKMDRVLTGKWTAIPMFILIMGLMFYLSFFLVGPFFQDLLQSGIDALAGLAENAMAAGNVNEAIRGLVLDGIFEGVGSVLSFLPIIITMFFFLSMLEDSGYIARLHGARRHVHPHPAQRPRPQNDHPADALHELHREDAHLRLLHRRLLPRPRLVDRAAAVPAGHRRGRAGGDAVQENPVQGRGGALRDGIAQLPLPQPPERDAAAVGKSKRFYPARFLRDPDRYHRGLRHFPHQRLHGKGERGVRHAGAVRFRSGPARRDDLPYRRDPAGVQPALHPLRGGHRFHPPGTGQQMGRVCDPLAVRHRLGRRADRPADRHGVWGGVNLSELGVRS